MKMITKNTITVGKVKTVFSTDKHDQVLIQYEDRVTAGNGRKELWVEDKGSVCCEISQVLFEKLNYRGVKTHYVSMPTNKSMICKKVDIVPLEVVVRNIAAGSIVRETTIEEGYEFKWPLVEFYLKDDERDDPLLTDQRLIQMRVMDIAGNMEILARDINDMLKEIFLEIGLVLVDFKLEFGYDSNGNLLLADELSPDGMRLWKDGESFDKDIFRKDKGNLIQAYKTILNDLRVL